MAKKKSKWIGPPYWMMPDPRESQFLTLDEDQIRYLSNIKGTPPPIRAPQRMPALEQERNAFPQPRRYSAMRHNVTPIAGAADNSMTRPPQVMPAPTMGEFMDGNFLHQPRGHSPMHRSVTLHAGAAEYSMTGPPILAPRRMPAPTMEPEIEGNFLSNPRGHSPMHRKVTPLAEAAANSFGYADYRGSDEFSYRTCLPPADEYTACYQNVPGHGFGYGNVDIDIPIRQQPLADDRLLPVPSAIGGGEDEVRASNARVVVLPSSYSNSAPYSYISDETLKAWRSKQHISGDSNPSNAVCRPAGCPVMIRPYDPSQHLASVPRFLTPIQQPPVPHLPRSFTASPGSANTLPLQVKQFENTEIVISRQVVYSGPSSCGQLVVSNSYEKHQNVMFFNPAGEKAGFTGAENVEPRAMVSQTKSQGHEMDKMTRPPILAPEGMPVPTMGQLMDRNFLHQPQSHSPMHRNVTLHAGAEEYSMTGPPILAPQRMPAPTMEPVIVGNFLPNPRGHSPWHRKVTPLPEAAANSMTGPLILAPQGMPAPTMEPVTEENFLSFPRGHSPMHRNVIPLAAAAANSFGYTDYHGPDGFSYRTCPPLGNEYTASYQNAPVHGFGYGNVDIDIPTRQQPLTDDRLLPVPAIGGGEDEVGASNVVHRFDQNNAPYSYISDETLRAWRSKQHISGDPNPCNAACTPAGRPVMIRPYDPSQHLATVPRFLTPIQQPPVPHLLRSFTALPGSANTLPLLVKQFENTDIGNSRQVVYSGPSSCGQLTVSDSYVKNPNVMFSNPASKRAASAGAENVDPNALVSKPKSERKGMKKVKIWNKSADDKFWSAVKQCPPPDDSTCSKIVQKAEHCFSDEYLKENPDILDQLQLGGYIRGWFLQLCEEMHILSSDWPVLRSAIMRKSKLLVVHKNGDLVKRKDGLPRELLKPRALCSSIIGIRLPSVYVNEQLLPELLEMFGKLVGSIRYYRPGHVPTNYLGAYAYLIPDLGYTMCCVAAFEKVECALTAVQMLNKDSREPKRTTGKKYRPTTGLSKTPILKAIEKMPDLEDARFARLEPRMMNKLYPAGYPYPVGYPLDAPAGGKSGEDPTDHMSKPTTDSNN